MGLRINLQHASWLAHILKPSGSVPPLQGEGSGAQREVLHQFLQQIENDFYSAVGTSEFGVRKSEDSLARPIRVTIRVSFRKDFYGFGIS